MKRVIVHQGAEVELWQAVDYYELKRTGLGLELEKDSTRSRAYSKAHQIAGLEKL